MSTSVWRRRIGMVALCLAAIVVADLCLGQIGRTFVPGWEVRSHRLKFRVQDPVFHHGLAPKVDQVDRWGTIGYQLFTNSLGLRDSAIRDLPLAGTRPRLAFIGDSFTEGVGYPWGQTFVGRVAAALDPQGIEVLNLGVSSYSPVLYYKKVQYLLDHVGLKFDDLIVFIDPGDILNEAEWYELNADDIVIAHISGGVNIAQRRGRFGDWLADHSMLGKLGYTLADLWRYYHSRRLISDTERTGHAGSDDFSSVVDARDVSWSWDETAWSQWGGKGLERALSNMDRLLAVAQRHHVRVSIALYPWPGQIARHQTENAVTRAFGDWARARHVPVLDLYPDFAAGDPAQTLRRNFITDDIHWNAHGHAFVAERVLAWLPQRTAP